MTELPKILWSSINADMESDCACPVAPTPSIEACVQSFPNVRFTINNDIYEKALGNGYCLFFNPTDPRGVAVLNKAARDILDTFSDRNHSTDTESSGNSFYSKQDIIEQLIEIDLLKPLGNVKSKQNSGMFTELVAWLHVTNQCNLRCDYCFVNKTADFMSEEIGVKAIDTIFRSAKVNGFQRVKLKYAGGEPTLNFNLIRLMHERALELSSKMGIEIHEVVLSNGTVLRSDIVDYLVDNQIKLMISLDGIGKFNDEQRRTLGGQGTFQKIQKNLIMLKKKEATPIISITVTGRNHHGLRELTKWLLSQKLPFTFNFYRENNLSKDFSDLSAENSELATSILEALEEIQNAPPAYSILGMLSDRARLDAYHEHTCGVGNSYMVIDHLGQISKCHMHMKYPITSVFAENPLVVIKQDQGPLQNPNVLEKEGCKNCEWRYVCAGGCPALTLRMTGRTDIKSPYCDIYKMIFPKIVETEAIRLLKLEEYL